MKKRMKQNLLRKNSRFFYYAAIIVFASFAIITLGLSIIDGFSDERMTLMLLNAWFAFYTMGLVTKKFRRDNEKAFWHGWVAFSAKSKDTSTETQKEDYKKAS